VKNDTMSFCAALSDVSPTIERVCRAGNTSAADSVVSPSNATAMNGSSLADVASLCTEVNERNSWSHNVGSVSSC
jgi:hypothetical protein